MVANLTRHGVEIDPHCPLCVEADTSAHLFFPGNYAHEVWSATGLQQRILKAAHDRGSFWFRHLMKDGDKDFSTLMLSICDGIWFQRNK